MRLQENYFFFLEKLKKASQLHLFKQKHLRTAMAFKECLTSNKQKLFGNQE